MKINYQPSEAEVKRKRQEAYARIGVERQLEAWAEAQQGRPEKLEAFLTEYEQIKKDNPKSEVE